MSMFFKMIVFVAITIFWIGVSVAVLLSMFYLTDYLFLVIPSMLLGGLYLTITLMKRTIDL